MTALFIIFLITTAITFFLWLTEGPCPAPFAIVTLIFSVLAVLSGVAAYSCKSNATYSYTTYQTNMFKDMPSANIYTVKVIRKEIKFDVDEYTSFLLIGTDEICLGNEISTNLLKNLQWMREEK